MLLERARIAAVLSLRRPRAARAVVVVAGMVTVERVMPVMAGTARATVLLTLEFSSASLLCLVAAKMAAVFSFRSPRAPRVVARSAVMAMVGTATTKVLETVATQARRAQVRRIGFMMREELLVGPDYPLKLICTGDCSTIYPKFVALFRP